MRELPTAWNGSFQSIVSCARGPGGANAIFRLYLAGVRGKKFHASKIYSRNAMATQPGFFIVQCKCARVDVRRPETPTRDNRLYATHRSGCTRVHASTPRVLAFKGTRAKLTGRLPRRFDKRALSNWFRESLQFAFRIFIDQRQISMKEVSR